MIYLLFKIRCHLCFMPFRLLVELAAATALSPSLQYDIHYHHRTGRLTTNYYCSIAIRLLWSDVRLH